MKKRVLAALLALGALSFPVLAAGYAAAGNAPEIAAARGGDADRTAYYEWEGVRIGDLP